MKHAKKFLSLAILTMVFGLLAYPVFAQVVDTTGVADAPFFENPTLETMVKWYNLLYGSLVIIAGMVFKAFGVKKKVPNYFLVILATAIILAGAFLVSGIGKVLPLIFSFFGSVGFYEALKNLGILKVVGLDKLGENDTEFTAS